MVVKMVFLFDFQYVVVYTEDTERRYYGRDGDLKSVSSGRDEDLKLIPITE